MPHPVRNTPRPRVPSVPPLGIQPPGPHLPRPVHGPDVDGVYLFRALAARGTRTSRLTAAGPPRGARGVPGAGRRGAFRRRRRRRRPARARRELLRRQQRVPSVPHGAGVPVRRHGPRHARARCAARPRHGPVVLRVAQGPRGGAPYLLRAWLPVAGGRRRPSRYRP
jgi:hypothetical protein